MHDIKFIRENPELFDKAMRRRGIEPISQKILELDERYKSHKAELQELQQARNENARLIGSISNKKSQQFQDAVKHAGEIKQKIQNLQEDGAGSRLRDLLLSLPNILEDDVPDGQTEDDNKVIRRVGEIPNFAFEPKPHYKLGEESGEMDFEQSAKISGSRFVTLKGGLAKLERALASFMLDTHIEEHGYVEYSPPYLVKETAMIGTTQLPKFAEDSFVTTNNYHLISTGEIPLTNMAIDTIFTEEQLPLRMTAFTPCFRSEAGAAGKDTRGMVRLHQFNKVEMVSIVTPGQSEAELERMTGCAEKILQKLGLAYQVVLKCSGDTSFSARKTYDLEVWIPSQSKYREISSCSNCGDIQARRIMARYRTDKGNMHVHTLNGSGLAVGRTIVAILENYQNEDGSITVPEILRPYMGRSKL